MRAARRFNEWLLEARGSTRPLALFRIMLIFLLWSRFAADVSLWNAENAADLALGAAFFGLTMAALVGWQTNRTLTLLAAVLALIHFHFGLNQGYWPWTHHHVYLLFISTALCALGPAGKSFSMDRWLALKQGKAPSETGSLTANRLLQLQLAAIYFWTAFDKTNEHFFSGIRLDQILHFHYYGTFLEPVILWSPLIVTASITVVVVEYFLAFAILLEKWLPIVFLLGLGLHATFYYLLPVDTFSLTMMTMYLFLLPSNQVHRFIDKMVHGTASTCTD